MGPEKSLRNRTIEGLSRLGNTLGPYLGLALTIALFAWLTRQDGSFMTPQNWRTIAVQSVIVGFAALGMTLVIVAGGIDLSVGSVVALVTVVIAKLANGITLSNGPAEMEVPAIPVAVAMLMGVALGGLCGLINGALIVRLGVVPFIITLGTMMAYRGLAKWSSGGTSVYVEPGSTPSWLGQLLSTDADLAGNLRQRGLSWLANLLEAARGLPQPLGRAIDELTRLGTGFWLLLLAAFLVTVLLRFTLLGRYFYAVGSNESTARLCGIGIGRVKLAAYSVAGCLAGLAGALQFVNLGATGDSTIAEGLELRAIAAVVIGGGSLSGGEGRVSGTLVGVLIMSVLANGCVHARISNAMQDVLVGSIIVLAVALDGFRRSRRS